MAEEKGFEPLLTESESAVLPLHNTAISAVHLFVSRRTAVFIIADFSRKSTPFFYFFIFSLMFISNAAMLVPSVPPP